MSTATQPEFGNDSWQTPRNARTLRAYMALRNQEIAGRIRELRGRRPQTVVAEAMGVAERTYQNWEAGDAKPNYRSLQRLAEYYGVGEDYILTGTGNSAPVETNATPSPFPNGGSVEDRLDRIEQAIQSTYELLQNASQARHAQQEEILARIEALELALISNGDQVADRAVDKVRDLVTQADPVEIVRETLEDLAQEVWAQALAAGAQAPAEAQPATSGRRSRRAAQPAPR